MALNLDGSYEQIKFHDYESVLLYNNTQYETYEPHWHASTEIIMPVKGDYTIICNGTNYYLKERDIYVAWALDYPEAKQKVVFRVLENALSPLNRGEVLEISKSLGHRGWGEETVYAFDREAVPQFIQRVTEEEQSVSCG